jgi:hypothetical protein
MHMVSMAHLSDIGLILGIVVFGIGALARTYMNILISRSPLSGGSPTRSTERKYMRLIREHGAKAWPLWVTVILMPLGIILAFGAIIWSNRMTPR